MGIFAYKKNIYLSIILLLAVIVSGLYILGSFEVQKEQEQNALNNLFDYNAPQIPERNITNEIFTGVLNEVAAANIVEQNTNEAGLLVPSKVSLDQITSEALKDFDPSQFKPEIKNETLKISKDNSFLNITKYIRNFASTIQKNSNEIRTPTKYSTVGETLSSSRDLYQKTLFDFYNLEVPSSMLDFHKEEISLLTGKLLVIDRIKEYEDDPIEAFLALEADTYLDQEFEKLKNNLNQYIENNNIQI